MTYNVFGGTLSLTQSINQPNPRRDSPVGSDMQFSMNPGTVRLQLVLHDA